MTLILELLSIWVESKTFLFFRDDLVDSWVNLDGFMVWVNADDFEEFIGGILANPVGVKNSHVGTLSTKPPLLAQLKQLGA
jgi:hypothetical protein